MPQMDEKTARSSCLDILVTHAKKLGLSIEVEDHEEGGKKYVRYDVIGCSLDHPGGWFCFSILLSLPDLRTGVWTREQVVKGRRLLESITGLAFEPADFDRWLGTWFEDAVLEELTRP